MFTVTKQRLFSTLAILMILVTTLLSATPVFAADGDRNDGTAEYAVKRGQSLTAIAKRFGLTVDKILAVNPEITNPNFLRPGQVIILPAGRSEGYPILDRQRIYVSQREKDGGRVELEEQMYLVRGGDNLTRIARSYGLTLEKLLAANPQIDDPNKIQSGELIHIPNGRAEMVPTFYQTPRKSSK